MNRANRPRMSRVSGSSYASKLMSRAGDGSTLSIDFTTGVLDPRITFSRADATARATFINNLGYVTTVSSAQDPRFDYDPTTLQPKGLLIEGSATNYVLQSGLNPFASPTWTTSGTTLPTITIGYTGNGFAPDNTSRPTRVQFAVNGGSASRITQQTSYTTNPTTAAPYTVSVWMKSNTAGTNHIINILGTDGAGLAFTVTPTWQRFTLVNTSGTSLVGQIYISNNSTSIAADVLIWGAQLEAGNGASSYIPTGASTVNRAVDTAIIAAGAKFDSWYTGDTTGTFVANWYGNAASSTARTVIATSDQTTKHLHLYQTASALTLRLADFNAAATVTTANSMTAGALTKGAFSYNGTATNLCLNGGTVASGTLAFSSAPTWLSIGAPSTNGTSITGTTVVLNNSIRSIKYWPAVLSNATLQSLTA
jgi:hypothetical protein